eukprot:TRINITY_DN69_c0_g1_i16.p1 TRINITY_DN69_c0_g1~~TRINITY_DN69_c0_g1_i16.p1  ORF type:complete len:670 (+),score=70.36 TRINITY_DN69_c0_g1_i16:792-2801(+)
MTDWVKELNTLLQGWDTSTRGEAPTDGDKETWAKWLSKEKANLKDLDDETLKSCGMPLGVRKHIHSKLEPSTDKSAVNTERKRKSYAELEEERKNLTTKKRRFNAEGIMPEFDIVTLRKNTCSSVLNVLLESKLVVFKSPPYTGKSSLLTLLKLYIEGNPPELLKAFSIGKNAMRTDDPVAKVVRKTFLGLTSSDLANENNFKKHWQETTGESWMDWFNCTQPTFILMDETQVIYDIVSDTQKMMHPFWSTIKDKTANNNNLHVLCFTSYGDDPAGSLAGSPLTWNYHLGLADILYTEEEFADLVAQHNLGLPEQLNFNASAELIYSMTGGHPGLVNTTINRILEEFHLYSSTTNVLEKNEQPAYTETDVINYLYSENYVDAIKDTRAVPKKLLRSTTLDSAEGGVLRKLLQYEVVPRSDSMTDAKLQEATLNCVKTGLIAYDNDVSGYRFASPLIQSIVQRHLYTDYTVKALHIDNFDAFVEICLSKINGELLRENRKYRPQEEETEDTDKEALLEISWQLHLFQVMSSVLSGSTHVPIPSYAVKNDEPFKKKKGSKSKKKSVSGFPDFYINHGLRWVIEVLREGNDVLGHVQRFENGGLYKKLEAKEKVILDFRSEEKAVNNKQYSIPVWHVCYNKDYTTFTLKKSVPNSTQTVTSVIHLRGKAPTV